MCELLNLIWSRPRGEWTGVLRNELPSLADEVVKALRQGIPDFATLLDGSHREEAKWGVEQALLTALGYQTPTESTEFGDRPADAASPAAVSARPVALSPPRAAPSLDRARRDLFEALTGELDVSEIALADLARAAEWDLPETVLAVALAVPGEAPRLAAALGETPAGMIGDELTLLIPEPGPDTRAALEITLRGRAAAVGHTVPITDTASSLRWARRLLSLTPARGGPDARVVFVDDHLSTLLLLQDESLARALAERCLQPLEGLTPRQSERLEVTLLAWLEGGGAPEAAKALKVHPQTVRYRLRQIEKLFGPGLRDPRTRFDLELALRSRRLLAQIRRQRSRVARRARAVTVAGPPLGIAREARVNGL
ncbi:PucR family transcriptional regulator [Streptomyces sp. H27-D2]|uniref:PucR family transcriptional regulator n=1 Tax=Streptomyces sp. H27-D2 TaxID=3046304 RepID=UPI002DB58018|nr:helix-turn-helix domain-containing protein [Streptomyces sp. H27-D2]MEC4019574.1 helix-turn-helix domain-containing protein [Streptomyces sp. H27-D2]